ncbi:MAG TPA: hypothetical protein VGD55_05530, partial [Acidothermaceae bacterium]
MKTTGTKLFCMTLAAAASGAVFNAHPARACNTGQTMSYYGGYVDAYDQPGNIYYVFWGYGTYGDPQSFESTALAIYNAVAPLESLGIGATRFDGVTTQYAGLDWNSSAFEQIAPTRDGFWFFDESGLPAPDPVTGQITLSDTDIMNEADFVASNVSASYDDIFVIFTPSNAPPPVAGLCGQHFVSTQDTITAWVSYPGQGGCGFAFQQGAIMHEITEATANPAWNDGANFEGWDQGTGAVCEIGDLCNGIHYTIQTQPASNSPSQITTQLEFSNEAVSAVGNGCVYGRSTKAYVAGLTSSAHLGTTTVAANTSVAFTATIDWGTPSGVTLTGTPAVASWGSGHVDAFARATNGKMYHASSDDEGVTVTWELLTYPNSFTQSPDAVSWGGGNVQVFAVSGSSVLKNTKNYGASWSGWTTVNLPSGVSPASKVSVASWGATNTSGGFPTNVRTVVAAFRATSGNMYVGNSVAGGSFTWTNAGHPASLTGDPDLSAWAPPRFDLFVLDTSGNFWDMRSTNGTSVAGSTNFGHPTSGGFQV